MFKTLFKRIKPSLFKNGTKISNKNKKTEGLFFLASFCQDNFCKKVLTDKSFIGYTFILQGCTFNSTKKNTNTPFAGR